MTIVFWQCEILIWVLLEVIAHYQFCMLGFHQIWFHVNPIDFCTYASRSRAFFNSIVIFEEDNWQVKDLVFWNSFLCFAKVNFCVHVGWCLLLRLCIQSVYSHLQVACLVEFCWQRNQRMNIIGSVIFIWLSPLTVLICKVMSMLIYLCYCEGCKEVISTMVHE